MSALHEAIDNWNDVQITWLLRHNADVNERDEKGNTPLMLAVIMGIYPEYIRMLLEQGADLHLRDRSERTPLMLALDNGSLGSVDVLIQHYERLSETPAVSEDFEQGRLALLFAIYQNDPQAVQSLLNTGANPNARNAQRRTPLMLASELGYSDIATLLLTSGADVHAREVERNNWTSLHIAAERLQTECARVLLAHGAEVDARDSMQWTALIWATFSAGRPGSGATVRLLLEHGADVHVEGKDGESALSQAGWVGSADTIRVLLEWGAGSHEEHLRDAFHAAFTDNNQDKVFLFIEAGLKIGLAEAVLLQDWDCIHRLLAETVSQEEKNTALVIAAGKSSSDVVRFLLKNDADPNASFHGDTALMRAYWYPWGVREKIEFLLEAGADVNARNAEGETPFTLQNDWGHNAKFRLEMMRKMIGCGADVNVHNDRGRTALMNAAYRGETSIVRLLLKHGAQIDLRDKEGRTALLFAVDEGHTMTVRLLLERGADVHASRSTDGSTPLQLSRRWMGKKITQILLEAGAID